MSVPKQVLDRYEPVIGLEVHVELATKTKIFCRCPTTFGAEPNTLCCPVCTGMPGSMPMLNRRVVEYAVKAGLALGCDINLVSKMDRKNYFYPDLPKAYQISQFDKPLCFGGALEIGGKTIGITRIHIEEDAGKLIHDKTDGTLIDCNRCGVPLIEIVSEPDMRSAKEASSYVKKLRSILLYTGISDCKMNEGSLRCDINLSVRKKGETLLGERTEMKNLNSFRFMEEAIEYEFARQVELLESGQAVRRQTMRYDQTANKTYPMRDKEDLSDYRFFAEPDLPLIRLTEQEVRQWREALPILPDVRVKHYTECYGIKEQQALTIAANKADADYFEQVAARVRDIPAAAQLFTAEILAKREEEREIPFPPEHVASLCQLLSDGEIGNIAVRRVLAAMWEQPIDPLVYINEQDLRQIRDKNVLVGYALQVIEADERSVQAYLAGKQAAAQAIIGKVIKQTAGKGDPTLIREVVIELLERRKL